MGEGDLGVGSWLASPAHAGAQRKVGEGTERMAGEAKREAGKQAQTEKEEKEVEGRMWNESK
eukprot:749351-Hanusia_phi.AAC.5